MAVASSLLDELIEEFLLRLPPADPAVLVHAALVCKPWYRIISDPRFRRRFREFHRVAPMLGFFNNINARFVPTSSFRPPDAGHFLALGIGYFLALDARHGRVLLRTWVPEDADEPLFVVWYPTTDERWELPVPLPEAIWGDDGYWYATVLCAAAASGSSCNHHDCHGRPFMVVYMAPGIEPHMPSLHVYVYSSEAASWSEMAWVPNCSVDGVLTALVGSTVYFSIDGGTRSLSSDLATRQTSLIHLPPKPSHCATALMEMENGGLGVARLDRAATLSLWSMELNPNGGTAWTQVSVIELDKLLPINARPLGSRSLGFAQGVGVFFIGTYDGLFSFDLMSGRVSKVFEGPLDETDIVGTVPCVVPYVSFYTPALGWTPNHEEPGLDATRV